MGCSVFECGREASPVASSPCSAGTAPALLGNVVDVQFTGENVSGTPLLAGEKRVGGLLIPLAGDIFRGGGVGGGGDWGGFAGRVWGVNSAEKVVGLCESSL